MTLVVFTTCNPWIQEVVDEVKPDGFDVEFVDSDDADAVAEAFPRADFVVCLKMSADQARLLDRCRLVMHNGVGYDAIAIETLSEMNIPVAATPAMTAEGVAEHVLMMVLALNKQLPAVRESMSSGEWNMFGWRQGSHNLAGKTMGIVGLGRIGTRVAHLAEAFDCRVLYTDIETKDSPFERVAFGQLLAEADVVTLHVPLTESTTKMVGTAEFAQMKAGSLFINASRGPTTDLDALVAAITSGHLRGAGVDVFDPEPPPSDHPVLQLPNVICTPHIASGTVERQYAINTDQFANCLRVLAGQPAHDLIS